LHCSLSRCFARTAITARTTLKLQVEDTDRGERLDIFLARHLTEFTRSHIQALNRSGSVRVEGKPEKAGYRLRGRETVEVEIVSKAPSTLEPQPVPFKVIYEDADLAVIEKPAGISVHPGAGTATDTLVHGLLFHFKELSEAGGPARPGIVHRIDKWTSGLLIVAKNDYSHARLSKAFQDRAVEKNYIALVHGKFTKPEGEIKLSIRRHPKLRTRMSAHPQRGRIALSTYRVMEEVRGFSLVEVRIHTGRTHQIRVHFSAIGHPVAGDDLYAERRYAEFVKKYGVPGRYFLHAAELKFAHPRTGEALKFRSPLPDDLTNLLERIRK
jgi:23S rRNA pseudouridine1911/1915/1917 synthase